MKKLVKGILIACGVLFILGAGGCAISMFAVGSAVNEVNKSIDDMNVISMDEFNKIQTGMTLQQAEDIVGAKGNLVSQSETPEMNTKIEMYEFTNTMGSNANLTFINGKLDTKAQFGLK